MSEHSDRPVPGTILRSQFFELTGGRALSSEQRLMLAVLADAINIVQEGRSSSGSRRKAIFDEARAWIFSDAVSCPLSFDSVCDGLGIDAEALRWRLRSIISGEQNGPRARLLRLRLKEASRIQHVTLNRVRRRPSRHRGRHL